MAAISKQSEALLAQASLQTLTDIDASLERIRVLREQAIDSPESRDAIVALLKQYAEKYKGTELSASASGAVSTILAVAMLEILQAGE